jgi:hypothetical protein
MVYPMRREGKLARVPLRQMMKSGALTCTDGSLSNHGAPLRAASVAPKPTTVRSFSADRSQELMGHEIGGAEGSNE